MRVTIQFLSRSIAKSKLSLMLGLFVLFWRIQLPSLHPTEQGYIQRSSATNSCTEIIPRAAPLVWWARGQELGDIAREAQRRLLVPDPFSAHEDVL